MHNTVELLQRATLRLSQDGPIKDRLADAYATHLIEVDGDTLPEFVRAEFDALCAAMNRATPLPRESPIRASVRKMSNEEAVRYAALVVRMFAAMARAESPVSQGARRAAGRLMGGSSVVQLLASEG